MLLVLFDMAKMEAVESNSSQNPPLASLASWVRLNVGGTIFATTRSTLAKDPHSFLYRVCRSDDDLESNKVNNILYVNVYIFYK